MGKKRAAGSTVGSGNSPASAANWWRPGQSGNPSGRPRNPLRAAILAATTPNEIASIILTAARDGEMPAILALFDRLWPRPRAPIEVSAAVDASAGARDRLVAMLRARDGE